MELAKRWRWLGIEFVIIVLGVLSALFVDTWVEDREKVQRAEVYKQRLITDIKRDIANLDAVIEYYSNVRGYSLKTLADLDGTAPLDDFTLMHAAFNAAEEWAFALESSTYNDLQNTGGLALIADVQLRIDLADYHRIGVTRANVWNLSRAFRTAARGIIPNSLQTAIHESCNSAENDEPLQVLQIGGGHMSASPQPLTSSAVTPGVCGLIPGDYDLGEAAEELRSDPTLQRHLRYRISQLRVATVLFDGQKEFAERLLQDLESSG